MGEKLRPSGVRTRPDRVPDTNPRPPAPFLPKSEVCSEALLMSEAGQPDSRKRFGRGYACGNCQDDGFERSEPRKSQASARLLLYKPAVEA
ncbi:hypothetical protein C0Q70_07741 [Pomacea canaliculata]|uniref:Uncharacterized protein n=1 Tax=Pomacea canaliculata TaxID=400727 RepID=A0A2T7PFV8_POMCA|nr:hypothetical protein C0Q70_07741 [Pomacea canaliculata]